MSSTFELVREAIRNRQQIHATYHGCTRKMCPHVLGYKRGRAQALFYQFDGESNSWLSRRPGSPDNWRCIFLSDLKNVRIVDGEWHTAPNHSIRQVCVDDVVEEVSYER